MPHKISINCKRVVIKDDKVKYVLSCWRSAIGLEKREKIKGIAVAARLAEVALVKLTDKNIQVAASETPSTPQVDVSTQIAPGEVRKRPGFWAEYVLSTVEALTDTTQGSEELILPSITNLWLDSPAYSLREDYTEQLNTLILASGLGPKDTELEDTKADDQDRGLIENPFVLVREILIRFISVALCNDMNAENDGDFVLDLMDAFIENLSRKQAALAQKNLPFLSDKLDSPMNKHFGSREDHLWRSRLRSMVSAVKCLHQNRTHLNSAITDIKFIQKQLSRHIAIILNPSLAWESLSDDWYKRTLRNAEQELLSSLNEKIRSENQLALLFNPTQNNFDPSPEYLGQIISRNTLILNTKFPSTGNASRKTNQDNSARLQKLYSLILEGNKIYHLLQEIDIIFTIAGWVPLLSGLLDFKDLVKKISEYRKKAIDLLCLSETDSLRSNATLNRYSTRPIHASYLNGLILVSDPEVLDWMRQFLERKIEKLLYCQENLGYEVINTNRFEQLFGIRKQAQRTIVTTYFDSNEVVMKKINGDIENKNFKNVITRISKLIKERELDAATISIENALDAFPNDTLSHQELSLKLMNIDCQFYRNRIDGLLKNYKELLDEIIKIDVQETKKGLLVDYIKSYLLHLDTYAKKHDLASKSFEEMLDWYDSIPVSELDDDKRIQFNATINTLKNIKKALLEKEKVSENTYTEIKASFSRGLK